jgi:hypothetical protein
MLPEVLGREFYQTKKYPAPLKLHGFESDAELHKQLNKAATSSSFMLGNGPNYAVRVGKTGQKPQDVASNTEVALQAALTQATVHDDINLNALAQVSVSIAGAPELPVYNYLAD